MVLSLAAVGLASVAHASPRTWDPVAELGWVRAVSPATARAELLGEEDAWRAARDSVSAAWDSTQEEPPFTERQSLSLLQAGPQPKRSSFVRDGALLLGGILFAEGLIALFANQLSRLPGGGYYLAADYFVTGIYLAGYPPVEATVAYPWLVGLGCWGVAAENIALERRGASRAEFTRANLIGMDLVLLCGVGGDWVLQKLRDRRANRLAEQAEQAFGLRGVPSVDSLSLGK
jgi:hypothetical protein